MDKSCLKSSCFKLILKPLGTADPQAASSSAEPYKRPVLSAKEKQFVFHTVTFLALKILSFKHL